MKTLLSGHKILDLTDEKASLCSRIMADLGALVVKIEKPGGDPARNTGPFTKSPPGNKESLSFSYFNSNKKGITLNIEHPTGRDIFLKLVQGFDAVVESFSPGYLEKIGLGYNQLKKQKPKIILLSVTGFGQTGPRKNETSCDLVAAAMGGQMYVTGSSSKAPLKHPGNQSHISSSLFAAVGLLLAFRKARLTGKGDHVDISTQESVASSLEHVMIRHFFENMIPKRQRSRHWDNLFHILPCKDGFIQITILEQWDTLVEWMDSEGMAADLKEEQWNDEQYRRNKIDHIIKVLETWTRIHTTGELFELSQLMGFPWAPVHNLSSVLKSPHLKERGFFKETELSNPDHLIPVPGLPFKLAHNTPKLDSHAPIIGEHNMELYGMELGFSKTYIKKLLSKGII